MLLPQLGDDGGPGGSLVSQPAATGAAREFVQPRRGEAVRIRTERLVEQPAADLPVTGGRVLPMGPGQRDAVCGTRSNAATQAAQRAAQPEPQALEVGEPQSPHGARYVAERVAPRVAVGRGVRSRPDADAVEPDDRRALHR